MELQSASVPESSENNSTPTQFDGNDDHLQSKRIVGAIVSYEMVSSLKFRSKKMLFCREEQQLYRHKHKLKKSHTYICNEVGCKCRVRIQNDKCFIGNGVVHNHDKQMGLYYNMCALNEMRHILDSDDDNLWPENVFRDVNKRWVDLLLSS